MRVLESAKTVFGGYVTCVHPSDIVMFAGMFVFVLIESVLCFYVRLRFFMFLCFGGNVVCLFVLVVACFRLVS